MESEPLVLVHVVSSRLWGGMERYALDISHAFQSKGWDVSVFTRDARSIDAMFAHAGVKVRHAPLSGYFDFYSALVLRRFIRKRPNAKIVIHTHRYRDAFAAILARKLSCRSRDEVRVVCTHHSCGPAREGKLMRRIYRNLDPFLFVSDKARESFLSRWKDSEAPFTQAAMLTLHPTLETSVIPTYAPPPAKGPFTILYLGRLSPEKGIESLIRAMKLLKGKRIRLAIAGTGYADYVESLHHLAVSRGVDSLIDWKGWSDSTIPSILECHAGICVSPREESFSLASLEFMACGRAQILPPGGAFGEYMNPFSVPTEDSGDIPACSDSLRLHGLGETEIAEACEWLASHREACGLLGRNARDNFDKLPSAAETMQRLEKLYMGDWS